MASSNNSDSKRRKFNRQTTAMQVLEGIDLSGKTVLITGANNGIGFETARVLAYHNAHVIMACRNIKSAEDAKQSIVEGYPNSIIDIIYMDCSKLETVKNCATEYVSKGWPIHILILNAGVYNPPDTFTEDHFESTFQINYLAHFYLVKLLEPVLFRSVPMRVVHVSSLAHRIQALNPNHITWEYLSPKNAADIAGAFKTYGKTKFCNILFSNEMQRRTGNQGITSNSLHPGAVRTQIARNSAFSRFLAKLPFIASERVVTMDKGAATSVYCATAPEIEGVGGKYFDRCKEANAHEKVYNEETAKRLWELSEKMINEWNNRQK